MSSSSTQHRATIAAALVFGALMMVALAQKGEQPQTVLMETSADEIVQEDQDYLTVHNYHTIEEELATPILSPDYTERKTAKLRLANGLQMLIISDPNLSESALSLSNQDGSWQNPNDALGLAHFVEHMLFMGNKAHPTSGSLDKFLTTHGSKSSNAQTGGETTTYALSVGNDALPAALERFTTMFIQPNFTPEALKSEINAVHQEFMMHKNEDGWRQNFCQKAVGNQAHPRNRFSIGSLTTLGNVKHEEITKFFHDHYSANLMHAVAYTVLPIEKATKLLTEQFNKIPNRNIELFQTNEPLLDNKMRGVMLWQKAVTSARSITLKWELPPGHLTQENQMKRPDRLVGYQLSYKGKGSLFQLLRDSQMAHDVSAGLTNRGRDNQMFQVVLSLTPEGMKNRNHVIKHVMQAVALLARDGPSQEVFNNVHKTDKNEYQWQAKTADVFNSAMDHASALAHYDLASYPQLQQMIQVFDQDKAQKFAASLKPSEMHLAVLSPDFEKSMADHETLIEPMYKAEYKLVPVEKDVLAHWSNGEVNDEIDAAPANPYIPEDMHLSETIPKPPVYPLLPTPVKLVDKPLEKLQLWQDKMYGNPWVSLNLRIQTNHHKMLTKYGPKTSLLNSLLIGCLNRHLNVPLHQFVEAGLTWSVAEGGGTDLLLAVAGNNPDHHTHKELFSTLANSLKEVAEGKLREMTKNAAFSTLKESVVDGLNDKQEDAPYSQAFRVFSELMRPNSVPLATLVEKVKDISLDEVSEFGKDLLQQHTLKGFFSGQMDEKKAKSLWEEITKPLKAHTKLIQREDKFHSKWRQIHSAKKASVTGLSNAGGATILTLDPGFLSCTEREALVMLFEAVTPNFYDVLRTKEQTGYLVQANLSPVLPHYNAPVFLVQSTKYSPENLLGRFEKYIVDLHKDITSGDSKVITRKNFESIKAAKLAEFENSDMNVQKLSSTLSSLIQDYDSKFQMIADNQGVIENIKYEDLLDVGGSLFDTSNKKQGQVAVFYNTPNSKHQSDDPETEMLQRYSDLKPIKAQNDAFVEKKIENCEKTMLLSTDSVKETAAVAKEI